MQQQHLQQQQEQQQQHSIMAAYASPNQVTTDIIQQYLDENKQLILAILDNQNSGKAEECAENQAKLQRNLMHLAAIADSQPQVPTIAQYGPNSVMPTGPRYMPHQQAQQVTAHSLMTARSPMMYAQSPMAALQQQQAALHGQLAISSGGNTGYGIGILHGESSAMQVGVFTDFGRSSGTTKQDSGNSLSIDGRGGNSVGQSGDGTEQLYLKGSEEEGN